MIEVARLSKTYGGFRAVDDVGFVARAGEVTGFLGPNGAGKTTTMRILVGLTRPDQGTATIGGHRFQDIPNPGRHVGVLLDGLLDPVANPSIAGHSEGGYGRNRPALSLR